eukprot:Plantae.Rhodophyta-Rhodochaete_pulchella.ctg26871.p1 GENE.Plantae.Rhodophyta-Rhodochaete_pulchella.ctg26871~~Plantae.Rhodophyta-Rhodochaete_pulchella.ctg26871.p1  ORF type:complete len:224 (-),score=7.69 Plantae.Rhodophyta-Rhodochaete_pulchella.ctg26871:173-844(-)
MDCPRTGAHWQQFVRAMRWMGQAIPEFCSIIRPLASFLEAVYHRARKRTKSAAARTILSKIGWGKTEEGAFRRCQDALEHQVTLGHRDATKRLCVYTDALDLVWSGIVTQKCRWEILEMPIRINAITLSLSGSVSGTQLGRSTLEKGAYTIMATIERMNWILATADGLDLYNDYHDLVFLFDLLAVVHDLSQTSLRKVLRWAVRLSAYKLHVGPHSDHRQRLA